MWSQALAKDGKNRTVRFRWGLEEKVLLLLLQQWQRLDEIWSPLNGKWPWAVFRICDAPSLRTINIGHFPYSGCVCKVKAIWQAHLLGKEFGASLCVVYPINAVTSHRSRGAEEWSFCWSQLLKEKGEMRGAHSSKYLRQRSKGKTVEMHLIQKDSMRSFLNHGSWFCNSV